MKIFKVGDKYTIEALDDNNWVIKRKQAIRADKRTKTSPSGVQVAKMGLVGYYPTLESAKEALAELVAKNSASFEELEKWINKIKEI